MLKKNAGEESKAQVNTTVICVEKHNNNIQSRTFGQDVVTWNRVTRSLGLTEDNSTFAFCALDEKLSPQQQVLTRKETLQNKKNVLLLSVVPFA